MYFRCLLLILYNLNCNQQIWGYTVEEKLHLGVREQKKLNSTGPDYALAERRIGFYSQTEQEFLFEFPLSRQVTGPNLRVNGPKPKVDRSYLSRITFKKE
jgi:hypothetical protein